MYKTPLSPSEAKIPQAYDKTKDLQLWDLPDVMGLETIVCLLPTNNTNGIPTTHFHIWIDDNGTAKALDLETFANQFPSYGNALLKTLHHINPQYFAELLDQREDLTADGEYCDVTVLFTPQGVAAWASNLDYTMDDFLYTVKNTPFTCQEDADDASLDISAGKICTIFTPEKPSAHEVFETLPQKEKLMDTWKQIISLAHSDILTHTEWALEIHHP